MSGGLVAGKEGPFIHSGKLQSMNESDQFPQAENWGHLDHRFEIGSLIPFWAFAELLSSWGFSCNWARWTCNENFSMWLYLGDSIFNKLKSEQISNTYRWHCGRRMGRHGVSHNHSMAQRWKALQDAQEIWWLLQVWGRSQGLCLHRHCSRSLSMIKPFTLTQAISWHAQSSLSFQGT